MEQKIYSDVTISKVITKETPDGEETRVYKVKKLGSRFVAKEGFKVLKQLFPSFGYGIDSINNRDEFLGSEGFDTFTGMFQLLATNLDEEHFDDLQCKLFGSLIVDNELVEDWGSHFDKYPQDYLEVLAWVGQETFTSFFMESGILAPWKKKLEGLIPNLKEKLSESLNNQETESSEES